MPIKSLLAVASILLLPACDLRNDYERAGELYQCFKDGDRIYAGNEVPQHRGGGWFVDRKTGKKFKADDCFCMGCIGI